MKFQPEKVSEFLELFKTVEDTIKDFPGCSSLKLYRDKLNTTILFTVSHWRSETDLDNYRRSTFFMSTWSQTKKLFSAPAEAWSLEEV